MKRFDMMFCGHVCLDISPSFKGGKRPLTDVFRPGKLVDVGAVSISLGGSVSNSGAVASKLGLRTCINTRVGDDDFGRMVSQLFRQYEVTQKIHAGEGSTSYSIVLSVPGNDRIFLHNTGTNDLFLPSDVDYEAAAESRIFHFGYPPLMKNMYEQPELLEEIFRKVQEQGCAVSLDMALPDPESPAGKADWRAILKRITPYVDVFLPSFEELLLMLEPARYHALLQEADGRDLVEMIAVSELTRLSDELLSMGAAVIAIKCGLKGYYVRTAGKERLSLVKELTLDAEAWADREFICQALKAEEIVSATGSGDSSISGFLCALLRGKTPEQTAKSAVTTAYYCLKTVDAASGIPPYAAVLETAQQKLPEIEHMTKQDGRRDDETGVWLMEKDCRY